MVLADRSGHGGADGGKFNGTGGSGGHGQGKRRAPSSPGNNNNGQLSDDSNNSDDSDHGMRVGSDYQAVVPDSLMPMTGVNNEAEKAVLVWSPCNDIPEAKLDEYLTLGKEKYSYNHEQALGMLCWHKFNLEKALSDLPNFTPFPDEWTVEDKVLFEQAFQFHDKHFHKIRQMLPDKSIASLVKYYYSWKKTRSRTSLMDRQARKLTSQKEDGSEAGSFAGSDNESESGQVSPKDNSMVSVRDGKPICSNCGTNASSHFHNTNKGLLCRTCYSYWRRTGFMKNASSSKKHDAISIRHTQLKPRKPPRGMHLLYEDLESIANGPPGQGESILKNLDSEVVALKRQVQNNKQMISQLKHKACLGIDKFRPAESSSRINARWTNDELLLGVQGVRKYGKDFKAIAEVIGNKTEAHVRSFFCTHSRRYDLESVLKEFELENGVLDEEDNMKESPEEAINQDNVSDSASSSSLNQASTSTPSVPPPLKPISSSSVMSGSKNNHKATLLPQAQPPPPLTSSSSKSSKP